MSVMVQSERLASEYRAGFPAAEPARREFKVDHRLPVSCTSMEGRLLFQGLAVEVGEGRVELALSGDADVVVGDLLRLKMFIFAGSAVRAVGRISMLVRVEYLMHCEGASGLVMYARTEMVHLGPASLFDADADR